MRRSSPGRPSAVLPSSLLACVLLACASLTGGCATGSTDRVLGASPDGHARQLETQVRAAAEDVLPSLVRALHGTVPAMPARFVGCQVDGLWRYEAQGEVHEPTASPGDVARSVRRVLRRHGFDLADGGAGEGVDGTRDEVRILVSPLLRSPSISLVRIELLRTGDQCENYSDSDDEYAEQAPVRDLADLM